MIIINKIDEVEKKVAGVHAEVEDIKRILKSHKVALKDNTVEQKKTKETLLMVSNRTESTQLMLAKISPEEIPFTWPLQTMNDFKEMEDKIKSDLIYKQNLVSVRFCT